MTFIGPYNVSIYDEDVFTIEWFEDNKHCVIKTDQLIPQIKCLVKQHMEHKLRFVAIFELMFKRSYEEFLEHPDHVILDYLGEEEVVPKSSQSRKKLLEFNIKQLLLAYNRWQHTSLRYEEVKSLCLLKTP